MNLINGIMGNILISCHEKFSLVAWESYTIPGNRVTLPTSRRRKKRCTRAFEVNQECDVKKEVFKTQIFHFAE